MKKITLLAALFIGVASFAQVETIASTSFEEEVIVEGVNDEQYVDTGDASVAHDLVNNPLQTPVDQSGGTELGVDARYEPYDNPSDGLTDGDFVGVTNFTPTSEDPYTDGIQGYQMSDADGNMIIEFDTVDLTASVSNALHMDYFIATTGWEGDGTENNSGNDRIKIYVRDLTNGTDLTILDTEGSDINDLLIEGAWTTATLNLPPADVQLVVELRCNSGSEAIFLDNIIFEGDQTFGLEDNVQDQFAIFPNPASDGFVNITSTVDGDKTIAVYNVLGKLVIDTTITDNRLNIAELSSGVYIVRVTQGNATTTKKLVIR